METKTLLITGFAPFGGQSVNPSWEAVRRLPDTVGGCRLHKRLIPVEYGRAAQMVLEEARLLNPDVIICVGQAGGRAAVTPEVIGINLREADIPDNTGLLCQGEPIIPGGENAWFSTLPVREMVAAIREKELPAKLSYSAGAYVCNDALYTVLSHFSGTSVRAGFIHVPFLPEQGSPSMTLEQITAALTAALEVL